MKKYYNTFKKAYSIAFNTVIKKKESISGPSDRRNRERLEQLYHTTKKEYENEIGYRDEIKALHYDPFLERLMPYVHDYLDQGEKFEQDFNRFIANEFTKYREDNSPLDDKKWKAKTELEIAELLGRIFGLQYALKNINKSKENYQSFLYQPTFDNSKGAGEYLSLEQYGLKYNLSRSTIERSIKARRIIAHKDGGQWRLKDQKRKPKSLKS